MLTNLTFIFGSGEIHGKVTERLRILIHISIYFQTLEIMEETLSDKNEPNMFFFVVRQ